MHRFKFSIAVGDYFPFFVVAKSKCDTKIVINTPLKEFLQVIYLLLLFFVLFFLFWNTDEWREKNGMTAVNLWAIDWNRIHWTVNNLIIHRLFDLLAMNSDVNSNYRSIIQVVNVSWTINFSAQEMDRNRQMRERVKKNCVRRLWFCVFSTISLVIRSILVLLFLFKPI